MKNLLITLSYHIIYTVFIILFLGYVDASYSDTFYKLDGFFMKCLFWGWILSFTVPMIYYTRDKSWLLALGCFMPIGVIFASYTVQLPMRSTFHVISATGGIVAMMAGFAVHLANWKKWNIFNWALIIMVIECIIILPIGKIKPGIPHHTFWIEFYMIITPVIVFIVNEFKKVNEKAD